MASDKKLFRGRFGGYNKKDVNKYIAEENKRFVKERDDMQKALEESGSAADALRSELDAQKMINSELSSKLEENERLIDGYKEKLDSDSEKIASLEREVASLSREKEEWIASGASSQEKDGYIAGLEDLVERLKAELAKAEEKAKESVSLLEKAESYEAICAKIDDILDHARNEAQRIIKVAEKAAADIDNKRSVDVNKVKQSISARSSSIIEEILRAVKGKR